jgi:endoglucanase
MLSGGPNRQRSDPALRKLPAGLPAMKNWIDDQESYAGNEVAINWNAPLVFLLAGMLPQ